jgi:hypothetical protein
MIARIVGSALALAFVAAPRIASAEEGGMSAVFVKDEPAAAPRDGADAGAYPVSKPAAPNAKENEAAPAAEEQGEARAQYRRVRRGEGEPK